MALHLLALARLPLPELFVPPHPVYMVVDLYQSDDQTRNADGVVSTEEQKALPEPEKVSPSPEKRYVKPKPIEKPERPKERIYTEKRKIDPAPAEPEPKIQRDDGAQSPIKAESINGQEKRPEVKAEETVSLSPGNVEQNSEQGSNTSRRGSGSPVETPVAYGSNPPPPYPETARRRGWEGKVLLKVDVSDTGRVLDVEVEESSGYDSLDAAARNAVYRWRFSPGRQNGRKVPAQVLVPIHFKLKT